MVMAKLCTRNNEQLASINKSNFKMIKYEPKKIELSIHICLEPTACGIYQMDGKTHKYEIEYMWQSNKSCLLKSIYQTLHQSKNEHSSTSQELGCSCKITNQKCLLLNRLMDLVNSLSICVINMMMRVWKYWDKFWQFHFKSFQSILISIESFFSSIDK